MSFNSWKENLDTSGYENWKQSLDRTPTVLIDPPDERKKAEETLRLADELAMPIPIIEDYFDEAFREERAADPQDVPTFGNLAAPTKGDKRIGLIEQIQRMDAVDWLKRTPFSVWGAVDTGDLALTAQRLRKEDYETYGKLRQKGEVGLPLGVKDEALTWNGASTRARDIRRIEDYLLEMQEMGERGQTFGAKVFDGASYLPAWMTEFFLTGGISKLGNETAKQIAMRTLKSYAQTKGGQTILRGAGWTGGAITRASLGLSHRVIEETMRHRIPEQMHFGPNKNLIINIEPDSWATSILKGWGDVVIEAASEEAGETITKGLKIAVGKMPFGKKLMSALQKQWLKIRPMGTATQFLNQFFTKAGYSNLVGEIGEERLATILRAITNVEDFGTGENSSVFERLVAGLTQDIKNLPVEATVLTLPAATRYAVGKGIGFVERHPELERLITEEKGEMPIEEPVKPTPEVEAPIEPIIEKGEQEQDKSEAAAFEASEAAAAFQNKRETPDLKDIEPTEEDIGFLKDFFHQIGYKEKTGYEPIETKDFQWIYKYLQMPDDIRKSFPQFDPVYQVQRARETQKTTLDNFFAEETKPYFELKEKDRKKVDATLLEADRNPNQVYGPKALGKMGLNKKQISGFLAVRTSFDNAANMLIEKMEEGEVKKETIDEFRGLIKNYVPHKWYGKWAVVAKEEGKTTFMSATNYTDRFTERDRLKKLYPNATIRVIKRNKIPYEAFQEAAPFAVQRMVDLAIEKAEASPDTKAAMHEALTDLYKSKGFGMHFIKRKNIPGYTEDLTRPIAEYFNGFTGYISKMEAIKAFPEAVKEIHPEQTPNLYRYALDYIKYTTGYQMEFANAKRAAYFYYLYGNIKSAALNMTQNLTLGWPVLSKHTNFALTKMLQAQARTAIPKLLTAEEKAFIAELEKEGHLQPRLAMEIAAYSGNPIIQNVRKGQQVMSMLDIFKYMEIFNRKSMAVALYDAGIRDIDKAAELIEEAHFRYGKGNRPALARGLVSPVMVFRSWNINYFTWLKNEVKAKQIKPFAKSISALVMLGGISALPFWKQIAWLFRKIFKEDPEAQAREALGRYWGQLVMRGVPSKLGISFTGSVGMGDILPTDLKSIGGVFADIPSRTNRVRKNIQTGDYTRAIEDAAPEALRNPMAAYRLYTKGAFTRSGRMVLDIETGKPLKISGLDATKKALGFQPIKLAEQWDIAESLDFTMTERMQKKQNWADRYWLGFLNKDLDAMKEVVEEMMAHNKKLERYGESPITMKEMDAMLRIRAKPVNIPPQYMFPALKKIREQYYGKTK